MRQSGGEGRIMARRVVSRTVGGCQRLGEVARGEAEVARALQSILLPLEVQRVKQEGIWWKGITQIWP